LYISSVHVVLQSQLLAKFAKKVKAIIDNCQFYDNMQDHLHL